MAATTENPTSPTQPAGWVLYDGQCGLCRTWVPRWERTLKQAGFEVAPLQAEWVAQQTGFSADELVKDFRLLLADNTLITGAEAYRVIMRRIWWTRPLAWLAGIWPIRPLFDATYRLMAANRYRLSSACRLDSRKSPPATSSGSK